MNGPGAQAVGVCFLKRRRPGFDQAFGRVVTDWCRARLAELGLPVTWHEPSGDVVDEETLRAGLAELRGRGCSVLVLVQPTMSNGALAECVGAEWPGGVLIWATPENPDSDRVSTCSLVGAHLFASILARRGRRFGWVVTTVLDDDSPAALAREMRALLACAALRGHRHGLIDGPVPGFTNMAIDSAAWDAVAGVAVDRVGGFLEEAARVDDGAAEDDLRAVAASWPDTEDLPREALLWNSRFYLALRGWAEARSWDSLALRCWPEIPAETGCWPYLALWRLSQEGFPNSMEGDSEGALSLSAAYALGAAPGVQMDWISHEGAHIDLWHPGNAPANLCPEPGTEGAPALGFHFNDNKPVVVESIIRPGEPVTLFRFWTLGGRIFLDAMEGSTEPPPRLLKGTIARVVAPLDDAGEWLREAATRGMAHHLALVGGHHAGALARLARLWGAEIRINGKGA